MQAESVTCSSSQMPSACRVIVDERNMTEVSAAGRMAEPFVRFCLGKYVDKGEDAWLEKPASATKPVATDQGAGPGLCPFSR